MIWYLHFQACFRYVSCSDITGLAHRIPASNGFLIRILESVSIVTSSHDHQHQCPLDCQLESMAIVNPAAVRIAFRNRRRVTLRIGRGWSCMYTKYAHCSMIAGARRSLSEAPAPDFSTMNAEGATRAEVDGGARAGRHGKDFYIRGGFVRRKCAY